MADEEMGQLSVPSHGELFSRRQTGPRSLSLSSAYPLLAKTQYGEGKVAALESAEAARVRECMGKPLVVIGDLNRMSLQNVAAKEEIRKAIKYRKTTNT
jgi:hypothetical protein